ncbi:hypothetical protein BDY19DRAFT_320155 [Irpex rosettiformis]|uniref:Uncharacterized protein n=1 Tax=Irpex rosettiformis TaxID=378272 RepID=A0ACB8TY20_9APHY|nr:hypothetical protein BDY19DRAFT_320155 [Irpex rosettiformis]
MSKPELPPPYHFSERVPSYAATPRGDEHQLDISRISAPAASPIVSDEHASTEVPHTGSAGVRIALDRPRQEGAVAVVYKQNESVKGEVLVGNPQGIKSIAIKLEGQHGVAVTLEDTLHDHCSLFSNEVELWQAKNGGACPSKLEFAIPFPATYQDSKGTIPLPPSFSRRYPGSPTITASVLYSVTVTVTKQARLGWWDKQKRVSETIRYRPRSSPPLPTPENGPPFLSITKQIPEEWCQVTTSIPSHCDGVSAIDCHLFIPVGCTYPFNKPIPFQFQLRAPMNHLLAAQGMMHPKNAQADVANLASTSMTQTAGSSSESKSSTSHKSLAMLGNLPKKIISGQKTNDNLPWIRVYLQRRITSKIYGENAWQDINMGEAHLSNITVPEGGDILVWEGNVECVARPNAAISGFSTSRFEMKDFIVIHFKPSNPIVSPWNEYKYVHPIRLATDYFQE